MKPNSPRSSTGTESSSPPSMPQCLRNHTVNPPSSSPQSTPQLRRTPSIQSEDQQSDIIACQENLPASPRPPSPPSKTALTDAQDQSRPYLLERFSPRLTPPPPVSQCGEEGAKECPTNETEKPESPTVSKPLSEPQDCKQNEETPFLSPPSPGPLSQFQPSQSTPEDYLTQNEAALLSSPPSSDCLDSMPLPPLPSGFFSPSPPQTPEKEQSASASITTEAAITPQTPCTASHPDIPIPSQVYKTPSPSSSNDNHPPQMPTKTDESDGIYASSDDFVLPEEQSVSTPPSSTQRSAPSEEAVESANSGKHGSDSPSNRSSPPSSLQESCEEHPEDVLENLDCSP